MADDIDKTVERQEIYDRYLLAGAYRKPVPRPADGRCLFCREPVLSGKRFCDEDCAQFFEREQRRGR